MCLFLIYFAFFPSFFPSFYCLYRHPCIHRMAGWCFAGLHCSPRRRPGRLVVNLKHHHGNGKSSALIVDTPSIWSRRFSPNACDILHKGAVFGKPWWLLLVFGTCVLVVCFGWLNLCYIEKYDYKYKLRCIQELTGAKYPSCIDDLACENRKGTEKEVHRESQPSQFSGDNRLIFEAPVSTAFRLV